MRVLVVGAGGREHALVWHLARHHREVFCAPGNAGIAQVAECVDISPADIPDLAEFAASRSIDLTIVGPEAPLVAGIGDEFERRGLALFGPSASGAKLEGDKSFAKELMQEAGIPTAAYEKFTDIGKARAYLSGRQLPVVVKASGLAAGKGVIICRTQAEAEQALTDMMTVAKFGDAGRTVVIEDCLEGEEASVIGLCDGRDFRLLMSSQDHKRLQDGDLGPNTGGMGAYAPAPVVTPEVERMVAERVFKPLLAAFRRYGIHYHGAIYAGMMLTAKGPYVLEFNCRFGDPETQAVMPLLDSDLAELALACIHGRLREQTLAWSGRAALCVVAAAGGYPGSYQKHLPVSGDTVGTGDVVVFHAGTVRLGGHLVTNGGRVLGVTGLGDTLAQARDVAYQAVEQIRFQSMFYRRDIGARGLRALTGR